MTLWSSRCTRHCGRPEGSCQHAPEGSPRSRILAVSSSGAPSTCCAGGSSGVPGVAVGEAAVEVETTTRGVVHAFTTGTMVQVFRLDGRISAGAWNGDGREDPSQKTENQPG